MDSGLNFKTHVTKKCQAGYAQLHENKEYSSLAHPGNCCQLSTKPVHLSS